MIQLYTPILKSFPERVAFFEQKKQNKNQKNSELAHQLHLRRQQTDRQADARRHVEPPTFRSPPCGLAQEA